MSAQAGVFAFDGQEAMDETASRLSAILEPFGPDGGGVHVEAGLVMAARELHVTVEDPDERQPLVSPRGNVVTWDGRLDNRADLLLLLRQDLRGADGDAAIALAVLERWGVGGLERLVGDWSLAFWDTADRTLHLASDFMGARPLYYATDGHRVRWASTLTALVAPVRDIGDVDPAFVVGFLTFAMPPDVTPYPDVRSVSAAHVLSWSAGGSSARRRFWSLSEARVRDADPRASADELRRLLGDAVRGRMRSIRPVWSELSGGLDSSTIVCLAHGLLEQEAVEAPALRTISYVTDTSRESDERPFIAAVEEVIGRRGLHIRAEDCAGAVDTERAWVTPLHVADTGLEMLRAVVADGGRTLLSGSAGDLIMGNAVDRSEASLDELVLHGCPIGVLRELRAWSRASARPIWEHVGQLASHLAPASVRRRRAPWDALALHGAIRGGALHDAVARQFLLRAAAVERWKAEIDRRTERVWAYRDIPRLPLVEGLERLAEGRRLQGPSEFPGFSMTFPYAHRPLVELVASLPAGVVCAPGRPRALMHDAVDELLPPKIRRRFSKGYAAPLVARTSRAFARRHRDRPQDLATVAGGYVEGKRLSALLDAMSHGAGHDLHNLSRIIDLERWLERAGAERTSARRIPA